MKSLRRFATCLVASVMFISVLSLSFCASANEIKRPENFDPWYDFENLNVGSNCTITGEDDTNTCSVGGITTLTCPNLTMDVKAGILQNSIVEGGPGGKLVTFGAGPKLTIDSTKYKDGCWCNINVDTKGDDKYSTKQFKNEEYFCFYADMTKWSTQDRAASEKTAANLDIWLFLASTFTVDDQTGEGLHILEGNKPYELQQEDGSWKEYTSSCEKVEDVELDNGDGTTTKCQKKNGFISLPLGFKGYVRFKLADTYPATYYNQTPLDQALSGKDFVMPCGVQMHGGFAPTAVGVGDDMKEPGHLKIGDFGFIRKDGASPAADTTNQEESKEAESKKEDSTAVQNTAGDSTSSNTGTIVGIIIIALVILGIVIYAVVKNRKKLPSNSTDSKDKK